MITSVGLIWELEPSKREPPVLYCLANDLIWETFAWGAEAARREGYLEESQTQWEKAFELSRTFPEGDPRLAASSDSLAVCLCLNGDPHAAATLHREAIARWNYARDWVLDKMPMTLRASSVSYHRGLQSRHRDKLVNLSVHLQHRLCDAGQAAAQNNLACALIAAGNSDEMPMQLFAGAIAPWMAGIGARDSGLAAIHANLACVSNNATARDHACRIRADPSSDRTKRFVEECDRKLTFRRRLLAAVYLSCGPVELSKAA